MFKFRRNQVGGTSPNFNPDPTIEAVMDADGNLIKKRPQDQGSYPQWPRKGRAKARRNAARSRVTRSARS